VIGIKSISIQYGFLTGL